VPAAGPGVQPRPGESRYVEEKRHFEKPIPISDLVVLDRERCVLCDRCTRFADTVAGDRLIHFISRGNQTQVNTFPDEPFSSYFSGNTVQICPSARSRPAVPVQGAAVGPRADGEHVHDVLGRLPLVVQSSRDELVRYQGVDSDPVNWGWLCDRGRYDYEWVNSVERVEAPLIKTAVGHEPTNWNTAYARAAALVREATGAGGAESVGVLGGARGTNEDAFAWARLAHDVIGTPNVHAQLGDGLPVGVLGMNRATIDEVAAAKTIILLGPDLKEELPVLYLRVRDSATKRKSRILELTPKRSGLTGLAWKSIGYEPGTQLSAVQTALADPEISAQLAAGEVAIVAGRANLAESPAATVRRCRRLLDAVPAAKVLPALRRGNVGRRAAAGHAAAPRRARLAQDARGCRDGRLECLVLGRLRPDRDFPDTDLARRALAGARRIIAVDTFLTESSRLADVVPRCERLRREVRDDDEHRGRVDLVHAR
jgi:NADH-quinone oxidoreductase subunit G